MKGLGAGTIGVVKLGDFGLAKKLTPLISQTTPTTNTRYINNLKTPCGTAGYTAPEVITANQDIDKQNYYSKAVDIWSLGCLLYTILCGFPPFYDDDSSKLTLKILNGDYTFLSPWWDEISDEVKDLIAKMLVINPNNRITIDEIFNHPWIKDEIFSQDYFNINSKFENNDLTVSKTPIDRVEHIEHRSGSSNSDTVGTLVLDPDDPLSEQPSPYNLPTSAVDIPKPIPIPAASGHSTNPLLSPRATAIKSVFNNPAMNEFSGLKFNNKAIFNIEEEQKDILTNLHKLIIKSSIPNTISSSNSDSDDEDYQTRQSSIISGDRSNEKFQLNMNDSNLISRRRSTKTSH
ncbi:Pkinase-domain-containing protein [Yamadazyma tenuis ATCC 10573]|nr:Pkinase-domain-containing protein [Yamadazyma tenuis ATCC 10573]EGV61146.1 Pkinase-domain-containing protein [Yamadazyma tenuis ATCC 10573]